MDSDEAKVREILGAVSARDWSAEEAELMVHALLVQFNRTADLNALLDKAADRLGYNDRIVRAVRLVRGPKFGFSGHGIIRSLEQRYDDAQKGEIVAQLQAFACLLRDRLGIACFITSGTLLGLIRENRFLPHDDDFDMAYVSAFTEPEEILAERRRIFTEVNASPAFRIEERTGGRAAVFAAGAGVNFMFDLFAGFRKDGFFNEFPLRPEAMAYEDIVPLRKMTFYGEEVFVPNKPEALLEVNYGPGWKQPDPTFRFRFGEHRAYYRFLLQNKIEEGESPA